MKVRILRLDASTPVPAYATAGSAGFDLAINEDATIPPGEVRLVGTGLVVQTPPGFFLAIVARSSTPLKKGLMLANSVGVIDPDYAGATDEIRIELFNFTQAPVRVSRGDRLAQGLFIPAARAEWEEVDAIDTSARGGFGSTGSR